MGKFIDLTGQKFEKLTVIEKAGKNKYGIIWKCECGNEKNVITSNLRNKRDKIKDLIRKIFKNIKENKKCHYFL